MPWKHVFPPTWLVQVEKSWLICDIKEANLVSFRVPKRQEDGRSDRWAKVIPKNEWMRVREGGGSRAADEIPYVSEEN